MIALPDIMLEQHEWNEELGQRVKTAHAHVFDLIVATLQDSEAHSSVWLAQLAVDCKPASELAVYFCKVMQFYCLLHGLPALPGVRFKQDSRVCMLASHLHWNLSQRTEQ